MGITNWLFALAVVLAIVMLMMTRRVPTRDEQAKRASELNYYRLKAGRFEENRGYELEVLRSRF